MMGEDREDIDKEPDDLIVIDLSGPGGNAFYIIGTISRRLKEMGRSADAVTYREAAMGGSSYDGLMAVSERWAEECGVVFIG